MPLQRTSSWSEGEVAELLRLRREEGLTYQEIGKRLGYTKQWVQRLIARYGDEADRSLPHPVLDDPDARAAVVDWYRSDIPLRRIAPAFGVAESTVVAIVTAAGLPRRSSGWTGRHAGRQNDDRVHAMHEMYRQGYSLAEVGLAFGIRNANPASHVKAMFDRRGLPTRSVRESMLYRNHRGLCPRSRHQQGEE